ncbi:MAG: CHRD domain-containing protein [Acetobacteraceae bacterium]|nr:CHRD domain-containing protein [Acetobacteraceae bacterium]MDI3309072.1 CHRD domain-containing protein [Acetobacteraceae bacterium]
MANLFTVTLSGDQETPPNSSTASGSGTVRWDETAGTASYEFTVRGVDFGPVLGMAPQTETTDDDVTNAHFHNAARGVAGPVVFGQINPAQDNDDLHIALNDDGSWTISGVWEPTDPANVSITTFADTLSAATPGADVPLYYNIHTTPFPAGEIRGQLVASSTGTGEAVDWNALAADVQANFAATGQWFASGGPDIPPDADWNALAATVLANFEATGSWYL